MTISGSGRRESMDAMLRTVGIDVTEEGKVAARRRRMAALARWTPERMAALKRQLGLPVDAS